MSLPFTGPIPVAQINAVVSFLDGQAPASLPDLVEDALALFGWISGQTIATKVFHLFDHTKTLSKADTIALLKGIAAGNVGSIDWASLLSSLLALLPQLLPFLTPFLTPANPTS